MTTVAIRINTGDSASSDCVRSAGRRPQAAACKLITGLVGY
ncbi:hypothetical protein [Streptomyces sp. NPDC090445]